MLRTGFLSPLIRRVASHPMQTVHLLRLCTTVPVKVAAAIEHWARDERLGSEGFIRPILQGLVGSDVDGKNVIAYKSYVFVSVN